MTRLLVINGLDATTPSVLDACAAEGGAWHLLLVGTGAGPFARRHADRLARLGSWTLLDAGELAASAVPALNAFVLPLVRDLPGMSLDGERLGAVLQHGARNLWWSLEITEKSPFRGRLVERLYRVALLEAALARGEYTDVRICTGDRLLDDVMTAAVGPPRLAPAVPGDAGYALTYLRRAVAILAWLAAVKLVLALCRWPAARPAPGAIALFTCYPYWWLDAYSDRATDRFFSDPPAAGAFYAAWLMWPRALWARRREVARVAAKRRIVPLQAYLPWREAFAVLSWRRFARLRRARRLAWRHLRARFGRFEVGPLVAEEIAASTVDAEVFVSELLGRAAGAAMRRLAPGVLVYRAEMQPWENAILREAPPEIPVVGFLHSPFGPNYLPMRAAPGELAGDAGAGARPMPGAMLVCGGAARDYLVRDGYDAQRIAACGPQRHAAFVAFRQQRPAKAALRAQLGLPADRPVYLVALAIVEVETDGLFAALEEALRDRGACHLLVRTHPNRPAGDGAMQGALRRGGAGVTLLPPDADLYEHIASSDAMICIGSTVAFEAMALDVMPVVYEHPDTFPATSLRPYEDALYVVNSAGALRRALDEIDERAPGAMRRRAAWPATLARVFGDMESPLPGQLRDALGSLGVLPARMGT